MKTLEIFVGAVACAVVPPSLLLFASWDVWIDMAIVAGIGLALAATLWVLSCVVSFLEWVAERHHRRELSRIRKAFKQ